MKTFSIAVTLVVAIAVLVVSSPGMDASSNDSQKDDALTQAKIKYAKAMLQLAEVTLKNAQQANRHAAAAQVPGSVVQGLENDVAMAKAQVQFFEEAASGESEAPYRTAAREVLSGAESSLKEANTINSRVPGTIDDTDVARRQAQVDLAKARLDVCKQLDLEKAGKEQRMEWEILLLQEDIHQLRSEIELLKYRN